MIATVDGNPAEVVTVADNSVTIKFKNEFDGGYKVVPVVANHSEGSSTLFVGMRNRNDRDSELLAELLWVRCLGTLHVRVPRALL